MCQTKKKKRKIFCFTHEKQHQLLFSLLFTHHACFRKFNITLSAFDWMLFQLERREWLRYILKWMARDGTVDRCSKCLLAYLLQSRLPCVHYQDIIKKKEIDDAAGKEAGGEKWEIVSGQRKATLETLRIKCCQMMIASGKDNLWLMGRGMGKEWEQEMVIEGALRAEF